MVQMKPKASLEYRSNSAPISLEGATLMITSTRNYVAYAWNFLFNHEVSPLRNIPDVGIRHYVLQALGFMWAVSFSIAIGSYTFLAASLIGHTVLIGAAAITVATLTAAANNPKLFTSGSGRRNDGEHE
jgi:hypothetical protein